MGVVMRKIRSALILMLLLGMRNGFAAEWFIAPDGKANHPGTREEPWSIMALNGSKAIAPGDTIWLHGGVYAHTEKKPLEIRVQGDEGKPIQIRALPGQRVTFTTGLNIVPPATYLWLRDVEVAGTVPKEERVSRQSGSWPTDLSHVPGGLNISSGKGCKFINLVIHDNQGGVGWWKGSTDSEFYGCLIYDNGWKAPDRNHGHAIYTQNESGLKTIENCILTTPWGKGQYTMHAYGSSAAFVDNFLVQNNVAYGPGPFLIGGGRPSRNIRVWNNYLFNVDMQLGYGVGPNENGEVRGNVIFRGGLNVKNWQDMMQENNLVVPTTPLPTAPRTLWLPNKYDDKRAHLVIFNWHKATEVEVPIAPFLKIGDRTRFLNPQDFYGKPLWEMRCDRETLRVPMRNEFAVFVILKD
jgi:hypothetical protein